jgi:Pretoxin HINT domain
VIDKPERKTSRPFIATPVLWASAWITLGAYLIVGASDVRGRSAPPAAVLGSQNYVAPRSEPTRADAADRARPIQDIRVGDRVMTNVAERVCVLGEARGVEPSSEPLLDAEDVDQETWRQVDIAMPDSPGGELKMVLLRPRWWIDSFGAKPGHTIGLDLPEMGAVGTARVISVDPCPALKRGRGRVVTGTYTRSGATVLDIRVEGLDEPIGATPQHPFYSASRRCYVAAQRLVTGERLLTAGGEGLVTSVTRRPGEHRVYNLEVHGDHVYRVSGLGVLVHNTSPYTPDQQALQQLINEATNGGRTTLSAQNAETALDWAQELNYPGWRANWGDVTYPSNWFGKGGIPHIHLPGVGRNGHVPVDIGVIPRPNP